DAKTLSDATKPGFNGSGDRLNLETNTNMSSISVGRRYSVVNNLEIFLPANASLDLNTRRGSIVIRTRTGAVKASTMRGDITVQDVKGNAELSTRHGDVRVQNVTGDVRVDGHMGNAEISNVTGEVKLDGDVTGSLRMAKIARGLQFTSSRTDLRVARLDGEITVDGEDLHASDIAGPVNLVTRSKNVHLDDVSGDLRVQTSNGTVDIHASKLPLGNMEINDHRGEVQVSVPARANFYLQA